jgi:hypothetical protein
MRYFSLLQRVQTVPEAHPGSYPLVRGTHSLGLKRPGREADKFPSSAEVKNVWSYTSIPQ